VGFQRPSGGWVCVFDFRMCMSRGAWEGMIGNTVHLGGTTRYKYKTERANNMDWSLLLMIV